MIVSFQIGALHDHFQGVVQPGDKVVVVSGSPPGIQGSTNDIRIHKIGDAVHGKAPIYQAER